MEKEQKKRGIKPGAKLSAEHCKAISAGHMGEKNPNYKEDRTQIKVGASSFTLTADVKDWLDKQPNKSKYVLTLIRKDINKKS